MKIRRTLFYAVVGLAVLASACSGPTAESDSTGTPVPTAEPPETQSAPEVPTYPGNRGYSSLVYDAESNLMVMFGGESNDRQSWRDTWHFDVGRRIWLEQQPAISPSAGSSPSGFAYDSAADVIVYYFGSALIATGSGIAPGGDTWAYDANTATWTDLDPANEPFGLWGARMAYDSESGVMVLFGGGDPESDPFVTYNDTYTYDFATNTFTKMNPPSSPPGRTFAAMVYDEQADRVLIFGGRLQDDEIDLAGEVWAYDANSDSWELLDTTGGPEQARNPSLVYDPARGRSILWMGTQFWAFDTDSATWTQLDADPAPDLKYFQATAIDEVAGLFLLFGGGPRGLTYDNDLWFYDLASGAWEMLAVE